MSTVAKPSEKPANPNFSSGPCSKRPGFTLDALKGAALGRSHRAKIGKEKLKDTIDRTKAILGVPDDYRLGIVPASDTGAVEMALWSMLGARGVDMFQWESFGKGWVGDVKSQLKLDDMREFKAEYGELPDLSQADFSRDVVFTWNGTTSGVCVPNGDWIADDREGLTICDATSAVFAMDIPWNKIDVLTYSWQKVMGGEGAHGVLVLSPRAVERLESYTPPWPLPKIFRMTKGGKLIDGIFTGATINTPSMLCVEDALDGLNWAEGLGGLDALIARSQSNLKALEDWVETNDDFGFLAEDKSIRSNTSVCLKITANWFTALSDEDQGKAAKKLVSLLDAEGAAYDIGAYRDAPAGLRIWAGATVETSDLKLLTPWLDWGLAQVAAEYS
ncbi:phosphoserine transaminase [Terasakiella sp. A23]|uniref:phosphoserine transaminase n=1 Tax=Terasakiella sp. FCG-A23 TaxID=3080561 RepID=UPI002953D6ED|nr:phosphoserine transaminase [Terasakiella sp. A23]MDV7340879.1 phosphoserine transaminase [Terasakiella sp. A23]